MIRPNRTPTMLPCQAVRPGPRASRAAQRGTSVLGMAVIAGVVFFVGLIGMRVFPVVNEFLTIRRAVTQIMKESPSSASAIREAFEKQKEVEYSITTLSGKDLDVSLQGERLRTSFSYQKEVEIADPVFLLIKFQGSALAGGGNGP